MKNHSIPARLALCVVLLCPLTSAAAPPSADNLFPAGGQRGKTVEVTVGGKFDRWPVDVWTDSPKLVVEASSQKGKLLVAIAADAVPGTYWLRLYNDEGASVPRPFLVGMLPEVRESEPNDDLSQAQVLSSPNVTVNGKLQKEGDVDAFAVELKKGQTLVASLEAYRTLRSPMDGILQILSGDGFVLAQNDDFHDFDPQIAFLVLKDGRYFVRAFAFPAVPTQTIRFAGGDKFIYRLTLTTGGFADYAYPLAVSRTALANTDVVGWNLSKGTTKPMVLLGADGLLATAFHPEWANGVQVLVEPHATVVKSAANGRKQPQALAPPVTVTGRIEQRGDANVYNFSLKKGQKVALAIESRVLGFPLDPVLKVTDSGGKVLAQAQAKGLGSDVETTFAASADGDYRVEVRDFHDDGGPRYVYRLRAVIAEPDFALKVAAERFALVPGKSVDIPVTVERRNGFGGDIELTATGLPKGVTTKTVGAGKTFALQLEGEAKGEAASGLFRIVGRAKGQPEMARTAQVVLMDYGVATPELWLTFGPKAVIAKDAPPKKK